MRRTFRKPHPHLTALGWAALALLPVCTALLSEAAPAPPGKKVPSAPTTPVKAAQREKVQYNRDVRPILAENCFPCHGPDSAARKADLRLDRFADATALRNGHAAIVKGNPSSSEVVKRISGDGPTMPPAATKKHLTPEQIATIKRWIAEGAEYQLHWSYLPPVRPALPAVKNAKWCRNSIDRFILAKLEAAGLQPAPEADRRTLIRRLSLDLTGLPPDPADVEAFVKDPAPDAYEKVVEKYLASPQWGEHRARYWLDLARYADTHGIHFDNYREMWAYRNWVIDAFNTNKPFDQFTLEQLAGDLLPNPTLEQKIATGFVRCNITTNEGGAIAEEYLVLYARDRTETLGQVWLGSTVGCAVCHDHKFDPVSQREFYSLSAFFNNTTQNAMDGNIKDTPPIIPVPMPEDRDRFEALQGEVKAARAQVEARKQAARPDFERWAAAADPATLDAGVPADGLRFHAALAEGSGREVEARVDGQPVKLTAGADPKWVPGQVGAQAFQRTAGATIETAQAGDWEKDQSFTVAAWVKLANANGGGAIVARMDDEHDYRGWDLWVENGRVGSHIISKWQEDALKVVTRDPIKAGEWHHVAVTYSGGAKAASVKVYVDGVAKPTNTAADALKGSIRTSVPFKIGQRHTQSPLDGTGIQDVRLYSRAIPADEVARITRGTRAGYLAANAAKLSAPEREELFGWWLSSVDAPYRDATTKLAALESEQSAIAARGTVAHVAAEKPGEPAAFVLYRGEYDKRRDPVKAGTPAVLPAMPADYPRNRLGLAKWLLLPEHPLTSRVTVNHFWQEVFGTGIVRSTGDFGVTGELPSHPELLDYLATVFSSPKPASSESTNGGVGEREIGGTGTPIPPFSHSPIQGLGWNVKDFFRLIVTSATYRQASIITPDKRLKDPANRLLSRGPRYRLDAEVIRDYALAASGLLVKKIGGPSVRPYQPDGVWEAVAMIGSNTRDYRRDSGENLYRRSMYTFWKRAAPPAAMDIFNAPAREVCTVRRERTNTPLQALVTLNDVQFVEAARNLAQRALKEGGSTSAEQIDYLARRLLARPFRPQELAVVQKSLASLEGFYRTHGKEARELIAVGESKADASVEPERLAAWTMLANQLMNLDEVLNK